MMIYISGKYTEKKIEDVRKNIRIAEVYGWIIFKRGHIPYIPHTHIAFWDKKFSMDYEDAMKFHLPFLKNSDAVFLLPNWYRSKGAKTEKKIAEDLEKIIFEDIEEVPIIR